MKLAAHARYICCAVNFYRHHSFSKGFGAGFPQRFVSFTNLSFLITHFCPFIADICNEYSPGKERRRKKNVMGLSCMPSRL